MRATSPTIASPASQPPHARRLIAEYEDALTAALPETDQIRTSQAFDRADRLHIGSFASPNATDLTRAVRSSAAAPDHKTRRSPSRVCSHIHELRCSNLAAGRRDRGDHPGPDEGDAGSGTVSYPVAIRELVPALGE